MGRFFTRPITWLFIRWAVGTIWMFRFGLYVSHARSMLRPGVLSWIRDPEDPDFQPIKEILDRKATTQLRKIGASAWMYGSLIIALFGANSLILWALLRKTSILPFRLASSHSTGSASGLDLIVVAFLLPSLAKKFDPETIMADLSERWWRMATHHIGLKHFFFASPPGPTSSQSDTVSSPPAALDSGNTPIFFARVPASDNSVIGSPLMIHVDEHGDAVSERGKEALRKQEESISNATGAKARYTVMRLPLGFGNRVRLIVFLLWLSLSIGATVGILLPLMLGRKISKEFAVTSLHDSYSLILGLVTLSPILLGLKALLGSSNRIEKLLSQPALGGEGKLAAPKIGRRRPRKRTPWQRLSRQIRKWSAAAITLLAFALATPILLGTCLDLRK